MTKHTDLKKLSTRHYIYFIFAFFVLGSYIAIAVVWRQQSTQIKSLDNQFFEVITNQAETSNGSYTSATITPSESTVYFPLAKLKLPASTLTEVLVYSYADTHTIPGNKKVFPAQLSISTHNLAANAHSTTKQFDCSQVVYADFETPSYPINPVWKSDGDVKLADGRTMNIYYAPEISGCKQSWQFNNIDPKAIADSLKQAVSY